jgi:glycosyltransferase involved in cell wall biosynthesis
MLREQGIPARALIVGDGKRRAALQQYVSEREAGSAVIFTGQVPHEDVLDYYAVLDVFVVPRVQERAARLVSPLKPFEAMAAGVPLVVSDLDALREIVGNDGERGRCFGAGDAASLADVLAELYADPGQRADLAERARDWVIRERQWSANGRRYAEIYARVLEAQTST